MVSVFNISARFEFKLRDNHFHVQGWVSALLLFRF